MRFLIEDKNLDRADRIQLYISYGLQLILLGEMVVAAAAGHWLTLFQAAGIFLLMLTPALIRRSYQVYVPLEFDLITILFLFGSLFLGEIRSYYERFWWWDVVLHTASGFLMGLFGFLLVYVLNQEKQARLSLSPVFIGLFSFTFAMSIGAVWEIFEFAMDNLFGMNMQKSGLVDTMWDLIVDAAGALVVAVLGYFYVKGGDSLLFDRLVRRFLERNPGL